MKRTRIWEKLFEFVYEYGAIIAGVMVLWITFYFIAPLIHEFGHIMMLKWFDCNYLARMDIVLLRSFFGEIYETCSLTSWKQFLVYISGVTITLIVGIIFAVMDIVLTRKHKIDSAIFTIFFSMGFLLNTAVYFLQGTGDIGYALEIMNLFEHGTVIRILGIGFIGLMQIILLISLHHDAEMEIKRREKLLEKYHHEF